jgi:predicted nucleotidyltransferase
MVEKSIIAVVRRYLDAVKESGIPVEGAVVYGSHARGEATPDSDIDLIVISSLFDPPRDRRLTGLLWRLRAKTDSRVEPVGIGKRQWLEDNGTPLICIARQEGERISLTE